ncbi:MAG: alpha-L-fucosidase, partial [Firmicutes bacterium]|nr:alpha-L-fucosidase [Bacillota bacterium]
MTKTERIQQFKDLGFGIFVHFGLYSVLGKGEWAKDYHQISDAEYDALAKRFDPQKDWAEELVLAAKGAGARYINLTTRHHDGFSLYDTCGLNDYDAPHICGRDLIREFVDACNRHGIVPFFYHTTLDWRHKDFENDFPAYLQYLRDSVEILCKNYGKIGGLWFDGNWSKKDADWEDDALYALIRKYQPDAIITNNTGLEARGAKGACQIDSVTFERGRPDGETGELAAEMCEVIGGTWGYGSADICYKSMRNLLSSYMTCKRYGANFLLNV